MSKCGWIFMLLTTGAFFLGGCAASVPQKESLEQDKDEKQDSENLTPQQRAKLSAEKKSAEEQDRLAEVQDKNPNIPEPIIRKLGRDTEKKVKKTDVGYKVQVVEKNQPPAEIAHALQQEPREKTDQLKREERSRIAGQLKRMDKTIAAMRRAPTEKSPEFREFLFRLAADPFHPLSTNAVYWLRNYPADSTADFVDKLGKSERMEVRRQAVLTMPSISKKRAVRFARKMLSDKQEPVKIAAAMVLGTLPDRASSSNLWKMIKSSSPSAGIYGAWAASRCKDGGRGLHYLQSIARGNDLNLSMKALRLLVNNSQDSTIRTLFDCLGSQWEAKSFTAASVLAATDPNLRERILRTYQPRQAMLTGGQLEMMLYLSGGKVFPKDCLDIARMPDAPSLLRKLALACMVKQKKAEHIGIIIMVMANSVGKMKQAAALSAKKLAEELRLPQPPIKILSTEQWAKWWLRQYYVLAAAERKAMLRTPWGEAMEVATGDTLDIGVQVLRITPGRDRERKAGASVEVDLMGAPLLLLPL